jgi:dolichol-phosphate mannosyltransferase
VYVCEKNIAESSHPLAPSGSAGIAVSVVIPCFHEAEGIHDTYAQLVKAQTSCLPKYALQFIFVDDASADDTVAKIQALISGRTDFALVKHAKNQGITAAIMTGLNHASTEWVASLDADCTYDPARLVDLLDQVTQEQNRPSAMITASPYHPQGAVENVPRWRLWISGSCSQLYRWVMRTKLFTYTSCFRVYRRSALAGWLPQNTGFVGLVEMIRMLEERGERITECPAVLKVRQFGQSKMRIARVARQHLQFITQTLFRRLTNRRDNQFDTSSVNLSITQRVSS